MTVDCLCLSWSLTSSVTDLFLDLQLQNSRRVVCVSKYLSQGTAVCAVAAVRGCVPASVSTHCFRVNSTSYGVSALVPLRPSGELPVRLLPAARGRYLYPPSPVSLVRLGVTRPLQFTVCYAGTEGLGT